MSTLEARITEVIEVHKVRGWTSDGTHREMRCHPCGKTIGGAFPTIEALEKHHFAEVIAAMLAPVIAEAQADLVKLNEHLAQQIVGVTDRVQLSINSIVKDTRVTTLREAVSDLTEAVEGIQSSGSPNPIAWQTGALAMRDRLRTRADQMEAPDASNS